MGNLIAPSKMDILIPTVALHHDPEIWGEDVHLFKPERFAERVAKATKNNIFAFCPFSLGPRNCVGMNFALTEIKIALLMILQRYRLAMHEESTSRRKVDDEVHEGAVPAYLLDHENTTRPKIMSNTIKQKRKEKAGKWEVPLPKVRPVAEDEMFKVIRSG
ncbi:hypothetical protein GH714_029263 [Hevea brasiliensis]|uniref:Cytochrome P450 n=1 Tax=Hevea brasiliensis TaxID=3981 RepID=A0A6A6LFR8_HEVBR|nr:hypothetical protein GH714_029263 [Hevea brasiliensis]